MSPVGSQPRRSPLPAAATCLPARLTAADSAINAFLTARRNHAPDTDTKAREAAKWADRLSKYGLSAEARRIYGALAR